MDDIYVEARSFAAAIVSQDMTNTLALQQTAYGPGIRTPIPIVAASHPYVVYQLLRSQGNAAVNAEAIMDRSSAEDRASRGSSSSIFCAVGSRGIGKTHLAYSLSKTKISVVIRIAVIAGLSAPWQALVDTLTALDHAHSVDQADFLAVVAKAKVALRLVRLLVLCYMELSLCVLEGVRDEGTKRRELLLRFHRNSRSDGLVTRLFHAHCVTMAGSDGSMCAVLDDALLRQHEERIIARASSHQQTFFLCFDEIHPLRDWFPHMFIKRSAHGVLAQGGGGVIGARGHSHSSSRGLVYGLFCCLASISSRTNWLMYITGTHLSLVHFHCDADDELASVRSHCVNICPNYLLEYGDLVKMIQHYVHCDDTLFEDDRVKAKLQLFVGRPYIFEQGVLSGIFGIILHSTEPFVSLSAAVLLDIMVPGYNGEVSRYRCQFERLLAASQRHIPTRFLLSGMVRSTMFAEAITIEDHFAHEAIHSGVLALSINDASPALSQTCIDLAGEPIVLYALQRLVESQIRHEVGFNSMLSIVLSSIPSGRTTEALLAYYIALSVHKHKAEFKCAPTLGAILRPLIPVQYGTVWETLFHYYCHCSKIMHDDTNGAQTFLHKFLPSAGSSGYVTDSILCGISQSAGVDLAFLVTSSSDPCDASAGHRLVAMQLKTQHLGSLEDALMALSPTTQYLSSSERQCLLKYCQNGFVRYPSPAMPSAVWQDHMAFCHQHPTLCHGWIRVPVLNRPISQELLKIANSFSTHAEQVLPSKWTPSFPWAKTPGRAYKDCVEASLICLVSLSSPAWLTEKMRIKFIDTVSTSELSLPSASSWYVWKPLEVDEVLASMRALNVARSGQEEHGCCSGWL